MSGRPVLKITKLTKVDGVIVGLGTGWCYEGGGRECMEDLEDSLKALGITEFRRASLLYLTEHEGKPAWKSQCGIVK